MRQGDGGRSEDGELSCSVRGYGSLTQRTARVSAAEATQGDQLYQGELARPETSRVLSLA